MGKTEYLDRLTIHQLAQKGLTDRQIAEQLGLSIFTIRKWRRKLAKSGKTGAVTQMGRPKCGCLGSFPPQVKQLLTRWRTQHPGWGAKTLRTELSLQEACQDKPLPSRATIARWLKANGKVRLYEKHSQLPGTKVSSAKACHEEWEMDARGYSRVPNLGLISLIDINDVYSRVKVLSYPVWVGQKRVERAPSTADYQLALRLAFTQWGLPDRLATDHDRIFYDETSKSPFPTRFHLWLLALGIDLQYGRLGKPTDQAITEHSHQTWNNQVLVGAIFECYQSLWQALESRKVFLNEHLPCASLYEKAPLQAYPQARKSRHRYRPEQELDLLDLNRVYAYLAKGQWFRKVSATGAISIGGHIYPLGFAWRSSRYVELHFDTEVRDFICRSPSGQETHLPVPWLSKQALMGELLEFQQIPYQFALPLSHNDWRALFYKNMPARGDTTF